MHRALSRAAPALVALVLVALAPAGASAQVIEQVVATIEGRPIWASEVMERAERLSVGVEAYAEVLDAIIEERLIDAEARRLGIRVSEEQIDTAYEDIRRSNGLDPEGFVEALREQGYTLEAYRLELQQQLVRLIVLTRLAAADGATEAPTEESHRRVLEELRQRAFVTRRL